MTNAKSHYIPWDKSWIIRMGLLDLIHNQNQILSFLESKTHLGDDLIALRGAVKAWSKHSMIDVGESGTLYRFLQFTSWKQTANKQFKTHGSLRARPITTDSSIINLSQSELLKLDQGTSQWASAAALNGDTDRLEYPPYKLALTYKAIEHWQDQQAKSQPWEPQRDHTIARQADAFQKLFSGEGLEFHPEQAEDFCFARIFEIMTSEEGLHRWPALEGHESNRITEMDEQLNRARAGNSISSQDHRVVQAIAMWGVHNNKPLKFDYPESVNKSWPQFWAYLKTQQ